MSSGRNGFTSSTVRRKDLKPKREMSDAQLLAQAQRQAEKWQAKLRRSKTV